MESDRCMPSHCRDAQARDVIVKDASAEALFPHQPQYQPVPSLPLGAALLPTFDEATKELDVVNSDMQVSSWQLATVNACECQPHAQVRVHQPS